MRCLVTGGGGFIGSHVVRSLKERGHEVRVLHVPDEDLRNLSELDDLDLREGDVRDRSRVEEVVEGCDWVFHLAALYRIWMPDPSLIYAVNVEGTRNLIEASIEAGVERVIYTSTMGIFQTNSGEDITENNPHRSEQHQDDYVASKVQAHHVVENYLNRGPEIVMVAPTLPIGPGDLGPTPTGRILLASLENPVVMVFDQLANLGDVRDIAEGHVLAATKGDPGELYLLGNENVNMVDLSEMVQSVAGVDKSIINPPKWLAKGFAWFMESYAQYVSGEPPQFTPAAIEVASRGFRVDCSKAKKELDLPGRPLEESVRDALEWFRRNDVVNFSN